MPLRCELLDRTSLRLVGSLPAWMIHQTPRGDLRRVVPPLAPLRRPLNRLPGIVIHLEKQHRSIGRILCALYRHLTSGYSLVAFVRLSSATSLLAHMFESFFCMSDFSPETCICLGSRSVHVVLDSSMAMDRTIYYVTPVSPAFPIFRRRKSFEIRSPNVD